MKKAKVEIFKGFVIGVVTTILISPLLLIVAFALYGTPFEPCKEYNSAEGRQVTVGAQGR